MNRTEAGGLPLESSRDSHTAGPASLRRSPLPIGRHLRPCGWQLVSPACHRSNLRIPPNRDSRSDTGFSVKIRFGPRIKNCCSLYAGFPDSPEKMEGAYAPRTIQVVAASRCVARPTRRRRNAFHLGTGPSVRSSGRHDLRLETVICDQTRSIGHCRWNLRMW